MKKKINLGCGTDIKEDFINLDNHNKCGADYIWDLKKLPLPFKDNSFEYVLASHVIEDFTNPIPLLDEIVRITKKDGLIEIRVPYETGAWCSMNHQRAYNIFSFIDYMNKAKYKQDSPEIEIKWIGFYTGFKFKSIKGFIGACINNFACGFYNLFMKLSPKIIDNTFLKYLFPGQSIKVIYRKKG